MRQLLVTRWRKRLQKELAFHREFASLDEAAWRKLLKARKITSQNQDTVLAIDWPHYCAHATAACGGASGWCYTFQGNQATKIHDRHVAMVDVLARMYPKMFAETVVSEVMGAVKSGALKYPNLRYSGSGELADAHVPALKEVAAHGVHLWGFTRSLRLAHALRDFGASVIVSCDATSKPGFADRSVKAGFPIAYTSMGVLDIPPLGTVVTFPVHKVGRVQEVVDVPTLCPKVVADFLYDRRSSGTCQFICTRCHKASVE